MKLKKLKLNNYQSNSFFIRYIFKELIQTSDFCNLEF